MLALSEPRSVEPRTSAARWIPGRGVASLIDAVGSVWTRCFLLAFAGVVTHLPALQGERIWDDDYLAQGNPFIKSPLLILETFRHYLFLDSSSVYYRPVQNISYIVDYFFWNTDTIGFHLTNTLLHTACGVLLYFLLRQLFASLLLRGVSPEVRLRALRRLPGISTAAFLIALIWVVHPVHSAAVDYISGRADSLAFLFASAGWLLFLCGQRAAHPANRIALYLLAAASGLLALCSREVACVWLGLFAAHLLFVEKKTPMRARLGTLTCCGILLIVYVGFRHLPEWHPSLSSIDGNGRGPVRAVLMARALGDYGRLMVFPANLHMERTVINPIAYRSRADWRNGIGFEYLSILGLLVLAVFIFGCARQGRGQLMRIFGAAWFFAAYLPISNVVPLNATVAEHWLYLPSVGFLIFLTGCALEIPKRHRKLAMAITILAIGGLSVRSYLRSTDWVTAETFYRRTIASGGASPRSGLNLGQLCANRGDYAEAERIFRKVLEAAPDYSLAQNNLASALSHQGKTKPAEILFSQLARTSGELRKQYPRTWIGAFNLAHMRHSAGNDISAIAILDRARSEYPEVWDLISLESELVRRIKGPDGALRLVEAFARKNWWHHSAALALGRLYAQKGDVDLASAALQRASRLDVHDVESLRLAVMIEMRQRKFEEARCTQMRAIARQPDQPRQYTMLSEILEKMGRANEARTALDKASKLRAVALASSIAN